VYSLLPALASGLFLGYGIYVLAAKGLNRVSLCFFALCLTTFFWQATWAVLFQVSDPFWTEVLVRLGYLLIIFLPTSLYHFLVEVSDQPEDRRWVMLSYGVALVLGGFNLGTDLFVDGYYEYFFGHYPKAGPLHAVHVLQTAVVVSRGLFVTWRASRRASTDRRFRLTLCVASLWIYFLAAVDYLCNYGFGFYPPGVFFITISLGLIAVTHRNSVNSLAVAASIAHEMRTPLTSIRLQAEVLKLWVPELHRGYRLAVEKGLLKGSSVVPDLPKMSSFVGSIAHQVERSNVVIDVILASARQKMIEPSTFTRCSMEACVKEAAERYPYRAGEWDKVVVVPGQGFEFIGSEPLMVCVLFNLLKNALQAIAVAGKGDVKISMSTENGHHVLAIRDSGTGIRAADMSTIFDPFFTTKSSDGTGLGLPFCRRVIESFGGTFDGESVEGQYTCFRLRLPVVDVSAPPPCAHGIE